MFISVFNYLCLKDCNPPELQWCWNESRLVKLLVFCRLGRIFDQSFFVSVSFDSFYKMAEAVSQQMRNCVCKTQTATTGTRPPLVASQYITSKTNINNGYTCVVIYKNQMLLFASWLQFTPFRVT